MKIAIIGYSGSGKSTLAVFLGERYRSEVLHLDRIQWLPGWKERDADSKKHMVKEFLDTHDGWVIDGNYTSLFYERRMEEADLIIELLFGRIPCYFRVWKRYLTYKGRSRPDMTEGCSEKLDLEFTKWVFINGRTTEKRNRYRAVQEKYPEKTLVFRNIRQLKRFLGREKTR